MANWSAAATALLEVFVANGILEVAGEFQVEIRNSFEMLFETSRVLPIDPQLLQPLLVIQDDVSKTVSTYFGASCSSIAYHMRVSRRHARNHPRKPTLIIFCYPGSTCNFEIAENQIMKILERVPFQMHLEVLAGEIVCAARLTDGGPIGFQNISRKPCNGSSIGIKGDKDNAGTLGGWVVLNLPEQGRSIKCALTSYQVIRSGDQRVADYTDDNGITFNDPRGKVSVEYPAAYDANHTLKGLSDILREIQDSSVESDRATILSLMANPSVGRVILSSGFGLRNGSKMDWALIESPATFGPNKPPPYDSFGPPYIFKGPSSSPFYWLNAVSKVANVGLGKVGDWVAKTGRNHTSSGTISGMAREVHWPSGRVTMEVEIHSEDGPFVASGDSGSFVTNTQGELVGMVIAKDLSAGINAIGFMTPIAAIQADVKEMTGGGFLSLN